MTRYEIITREKEFIASYLREKHSQPAPLISIKIGRPIPLVWCERCQQHQPRDVADGRRWCGKCGYCVDEEWRG